MFSLFLTLLIAVWAYGGDWQRWEREKWERHIALCHHHIGLQTTFTRLRITQRGSTKYSWENLNWVNNMNSFTVSLVNQYQFLNCFVVSANKVLLITQIWKVSKVNHYKKLTEYQFYLTLSFHMPKWANLQSKQSKASQIKLAEKSLKGFKTD